MRPRDAEQLAFERRVSGVDPPELGLRGRAQDVAEHLVEDRFRAPEILLARPLHRRDGVLQAVQLPGCVVGRTPPPINASPPPPWAAPPDADPRGLGVHISWAAMNTDPRSLPPAGEGSASLAPPDEDPQPPGPGAPVSFLPASGMSSRSGRESSESQNSTPSAALSESPPLASTASRAVSSGKLITMSCCTIASLAACLPSSPAATGPPTPPPVVAGLPPPSPPLAALLPLLAILPFRSVRMSIGDNFLT